MDLSTLDPTAPAIERVRLGVQWLDENQPGWRDRVSINELDLSDQCHCVLGQLFAPDSKRLNISWQRSVRQVESDEWPGWMYAVAPSKYVTAWFGDRYPKHDEGYLLTLEQAVALGFEYDDHSLESITLRDDYKTLTCLWRQVLKGVPLDELSLDE